MATTEEVQERQSQLKDKVVQSNIFSKLSYDCFDAPDDDVSSRTAFINFNYMKESLFMLKMTQNNALSALKDKQA